MTRHVDFDVLPISTRCVLGESPWWDGDRLSWIDIRSQKILSSNLDGKEYAEIETPGTPGFAIPTPDDDYAVGLQDGLWAYRRRTMTWEHLWTAPHSTATHRMNDAKSDALGRIWMGSMTYEEVEPTSALYMWERGRVEQVLDGIVTSNGLGWSPDGRTFYYTDSIARTIWAFDFEPDSGRISNRREFATDPQDWVPDGMGVDGDGFIWSCKWNGHRIVRYAPDGRVDRTIEVPVARPTSISFAGVHGSIMAVTTAYPDDFTHHGELDGVVLLIDTGISTPVLQPAMA